MFHVGADRRTDYGFSAAAIARRAEAVRDAKFSWALILLLSLATIAVAATATMSQAEQTPIPTAIDR